MKYIITISIGIGIGIGITYLGYKLYEKYGINEQDKMIRDLIYEFIRNTK